MSIESDSLRVEAGVRCADSAGERLRVLVLEPYYGGSHRAVLDGLLANLEVEADLLTLPARKWKWRMRGSAITMAQEVRAIHARRSSDSAHAHFGENSRTWDLIYASTFINLAEFYGMAGGAVAGVPSIVYFHENQLVYPNRHEAEWDYQFPLTNITSALAADCCLFNSPWTMDSFIEGIPEFLRAFPDHLPRGVAESIAVKAKVLEPPFDPGPFDSVLGPSGIEGASRGVRPRILWPHRWEHDKDPDSFIDAVIALADEGLDFEVALAGQAFRDVPDSISNARSVLGPRLVHIGEPSTRAEYASLLACCDIAVSTALNEFFGLAMIEAAYSGCYPVVPDRLAYKTLYPPEMRFETQDGLVARLRSLILEPPTPGQGRGIAERFTFDRLIPQYARVLREVAAKSS